MDRLVALAAATLALAAPLALASCGPPPSPSAAPAPSASPSAPASTSAATPAPSSAPSAVATASPTNTVPTTPAAPPLPAVAFTQVEPTKLPGKPPVLGVVAPAKNLVIPTAKAAAFEVRLSAKDWKPAAGDHLCVVFDKRPCYRATDPTKPIRLADLGVLDEGHHVVSVLARHATGEFFRPAGKAVPFASVSFFVGKKVATTHKDGAPMLFYSPPERGPAPGEGVLVDFFVANAVVRSGDVVIHASVGGPGIERGVGLSIDANKPLRLTNARVGEYLSRMTLMQFVPAMGESSSFTTVTYTAKPVPGPFGEVERSIFVTK